MEKPQYDLTKAEAVKRGILMVGYIFPVADDIWVPLTLNGELLGPPSYEEDATSVVIRNSVK